jgi:O-antigen/teichoic acid export membrane protein
LAVVRSSAIWTIADQGVVSIGNFASGVILARHLSQASYGAFALLLASMLFLNSLHGALVTSPLSVCGSIRDRERFRRSSSAALWLTLALLPVLGLAMGLAVLRGTDLGVSAIGIAPLAASAVAAMLLWQMQETTRRGLMTELRFAACVPGDALSYLGQAALLAWMAESGTLTLPRAFVIIGVTSAMATVVQAVQIGLARVRFAELWEITRDFWILGRWALLANLATFVTTVGYAWTLRFSHGLEATAAFAAMIVPLKLANPLLMGIGNLLVPAVARVRSRDGVRATIRIAGRYGFLGGVAVFSYYALLFVFPAGALRLAFGANSPFLKEAVPLRFYLLSMCVCYVEMVLLGWLYGLGNSRATFLTRFVQASVSVLIALPAIVVFGIPGWIGGEFISTTLAVVVQLYLLRRALNPPPQFEAVRIAA